MTEKKFIELADPLQLPALCQQMIKGYLWLKYSFGRKHDTIVHIDRIVVYGTVRQRQNATVSQEDADAIKNIEDRAGFTSR